MRIIFSKQKDQIKRKISFFKTSKVWKIIKKGDLLVKVISKFEYFIVNVNCINSLLIFHLSLGKSILKIIKHFKDDDDDNKSLTYPI